MINTDLSYDDLVNATAFMADRLLAAQDQALDLNQQLAAAQGEVAALRGMLEFEQERTRELRNRGDHWQIVAAEPRPHLGDHWQIVAAEPRPHLGGHWPMVASASPPRLFGKLRRSFG